MDPYDAWKTTPPDDGEVCPECGEEMEFDGDCHWTCEDCGEETTDFSQLDEGDIWAIREGI
jgi:tRNA(Ile2) C34 agmatinyltransferase TiaS